MITNRASGPTYVVDVTDIQYVRHKDVPLLARIFRPRGIGPFPLLIELHGGGWCTGDRLNDTVINERLARSGIVVAALDFRSPPLAAYPASLVDINYAIRWFKTMAGDLNSRPNLVGLLGTSSGGHQAMLSAMRPREPRYAALPLPAGVPVTDATVRFVVLLWPVIDPLARYRYAKNSRTTGGQNLELAETLLQFHDQYWGNETAMAEGNPVLALERGESVETPRVLYLQATHDLAHPRVDLERFVKQYGSAGGPIDVELYEGASGAFMRTDADSVASRRGLDRIINFVREELE